MWKSKKEIFTLIFNFRKEKNASKDLYYIMSSNKLSKAGMLYDNMAIQDPRSKSLNSYSTQ